MTVPSVQWDRPAYREAPEGVKINLENAKVSAWFPNEATVNFIIGGKEYHGWMPDYAVNITEKWLKAFIVGDYRNGIGKFKSQMKPYSPRNSCASRKRTRTLWS